MASEQHRRLATAGENEWSINIVNLTSAEMRPPASPETATAAPILTPPTNDDHVPILSFERGINELATVFTNAFQVPTTTMPQGGNNNNEVPTDVPTGAATNLALALWIVALITLCMVISTALYKPARGVVFGHNKAAYYLALTVIFIAGVLEVLTAMWVSRSPNTNRRRFSFGRVVLCVSIGPLVAIIGIDGFTIIKA